MLTPQERRVLELAADGQRDWEIANAIGIGEPAVRMTFSRLYDKLGIATEQCGKVRRREAVRQYLSGEAFDEC